MGIRGVLRAAGLLLLVQTWLEECGAQSPSAGRHLDRATVPDVVQDLFKCKNCANEAVVHKVLDRVLMGYDARLRPNFGGDPLSVGISVYISRIEQISEINMDYTITMFFHQTWKDSRLAYYETNLNLTVDYQMLDKLWVPDCYFLNSKHAFVHDVTVPNRAFQLQPDGRVRYGIRLTTTAACSLDLQKYPLDKQACKLEIESYGYTVEDIILFWEDDGHAFLRTEELSIPEFSFLGQTITSKEVDFYTGSYMRLILRFQVQRGVTSFLVEVYWPTVLTTVLSWISFWMNYDSSAARVTVGLTSMLILTTVNSHVRNKVPPVACIKAIDIYMMVCFFFVFFSLMEYVYINYLFHSRGARCHHRRRRRTQRVLNHYHYQEVCPEHQRPQLEMVEFVTETNCDAASAEGTWQLGPEADEGDLSSIDDDLDSILSIPALARLASPESLSSLASSPERARLATSESLSSLGSVSSLASGESLSQLPSTSAQALLVHGVPSETRSRTEAHGLAEALVWEEIEVSSSSDGGQHLFNHGRQRGRVASWELDEICSLLDEARVESGCPDLEENPEGDADGTWRREEEILFCVQEEDGGSESDDSFPVSLGYYFAKGLSSQLFNPAYVPKVDRWSRFLFPLAFGLFNIAYWAYHIN